MQLSGECTHKFELCLAPGRDADGLDALLTRHFIVEAEERLMGLHALPALALHNLERQFQCIFRAERECWGWAFDRQPAAGDTVEDGGLRCGRDTCQRCLTSARNCLRLGAQLGSVGAADDHSRVLESECRRVYRGDGEKSEETAAEDTHGCWWLNGRSLLPSVSSDLHGTAF